ncbi:MAG: low affinity iron permease family protein [Candidatus Paceibacterota bacterium]|jgi:low affinity Fe/Cu permease
MKEIFRKIAHSTGEAMGSPWAFVWAVVFVLGWVLTGPYFGYSSGWQLVINTGTTILTFLMVFLIQNIQNRDTKAIHLKLDEVIRSIKSARNELVDLEDMNDTELDQLQKEFEVIRSQSKKNIAN